MAVFRILISSIVLFDQLSAFASGAVDPIYMPLDAGGLGTGTRMLSPWVYLFGHTPLLVWATWVGSVVFSALLLVGFGGRVTCFVLLQSLLTFHSFPVDVGGGYDRLLTAALFFLFLSDSTRTWSLDCRRRTGRWASDEPILALGRYLALFHMVVMYTHTGFAKDGRGWSRPYDAVYYALQRRRFARFDDPDIFGSLYPLTQIGTVVSWWWEVLFALFGVWLIAVHGGLGRAALRWAERIDLRWLFLGIGVVFHVVLGWFMALGTFSAVALSYYVLFHGPRKAQVS